MRDSSKSFCEKMITFLPTTQTSYYECVKDDYIGVDTVVIEDVFMPELLKLLECNSDVVKLSEIFQYFEEISNNNDIALRNLFIVSVLEVLGNDKEILKIAQNYMGTNTKYLQRLADINLGRK